MAIKFNDCDISGNNTGVRTPSSADISFEKTRITDNETGVDVFISKEDIIALGLPEDTDPAYVKEAIIILKDNADAPEEVKRYMLSKTKLFEWLGNASSIVTIGTALIQLASK
nr:hypothetical protein [uncultured Vibrio sp.]